MGNSFGVSVTVDYEVESAWLLRWLTLDSADEITADECMEAAEIIGGRAFGEILGMLMTLNHLIILLRWRWNI